MVRLDARAGLADVVCLALLTAVVLFCALSPIWEMDVFWHIPIGRYVLDHGRLPSADIWSAADPSRPYHSAQWLWELGAAWLDRRFGLEGVRVANAVWVTLTFVLAYALVRRRAVGPATALMCALLLLAAFHDRIRVRPHVVNLTAELLLVAWVTGGEARWWHCGAFLVGFFVWTGAHIGGAWLGLLALAAYAFVVVVDELRRGVKERRLLVLAVTLAAAVGLAISPGALRWGEAGEGALGAMAYASEWRRWPALSAGIDLERWPHVLLARIFPPAALLAWLAAAARWLRGDRRAAIPAELAPAAIFVAASFGWWRFFYQGALALWIARPPSPARRGWPLAVSALLVAVILHYEMLGYPGAGAALASRATTVDTRYFPAMTTALLVDAGLEARVGTLPNWGGYVTYHGWPRLRATIDGRFHGPDEVVRISEELVTIAESGAGRERLAALYRALPADLLIIPPALRPTGTPEWVPILATPTEELHARRSSMSADWMARLRRVVEARRRAEAAAPGL